MFGLYEIADGISMWYFLYLFMEISWILGSGWVRPAKFHIEISPWLIICFVFDILPEIACICMLCITRSRINMILIYSVDISYVKKVNGDHV